MTIFSLALMGLLAATQGPVTRGLVESVATGRPIAGATVLILGQPGSARTGSDGRFVWPQLPPAPFSVVVVLPDGRIARPIRVETLAATSELRLSVDESWSETLTVRGAAPDIAASPAAALSSETTSGLALRHPMTLSQAIESVPGVSWIAEGQSAAPAIRGLARGRTLILLDGARVSTERGAGPTASFLDPAWLARVDVARGPGSVAYGTDAFGGVIAARTRSVDTTVPWRVRVTGTLGGGLPEQRADVEIQHGYGSGGVLTAARLRRFDDYASPDGVVPSSAWEDSGARVVWTQAMLAADRLTVSFQTDEARDVGHPRSDSNTVVATSPFERSQRLTVSYERPVLGAWREARVDVLVGASEDRLEQDRLAAPGRPRRLERADSRARDLQLRASGGRSIGAVTLRTGGELHRRYGVSTTDTTFQYNAAGALVSSSTTRSLEAASRTGAGVFVESGVAVRRWLRLTGGVRGEGIRVTNEGGFFGDRARRVGAVAAMGALTWAPASTWLVTAQIARGFRDPTVTDRFSRGPVGRGFLEGHPGLLPEASRQVDLIVRYAAGRVTVDTATYRYVLSNLVERYLAGADLFRLRNRSRARLTGLEIAARVDVGRGLAIDVVAQTARGRDASDDTPLNDVPPSSVALMARHAWASRVESYLRVAAVAAHDEAGPADVRTPGYTLVDAAARVALTSRLEIRATLRNALDRRYPSSAGPRWVLAPGRQAVVTIVASSR